MHRANKEEIIGILEKERLAYIATTNGHYVDNAVVCFSSIDLFVYFGCFEDTLKGKNITKNPHVAVAIGPLQIHGIARQITYQSDEYEEKIKSYRLKWPQYAPVFDKEKNELYEIRPLVIWKYDPGKGEMNRDVIIMDEEYYRKLQPYEARKEYPKKGNVKQERRF